MGQGTNMINCSLEGNSSGKVKSSKNSTLEWKCFIDNNYSVATVMLEKNDRWYLDCHRIAPPPSHGMNQLLVLKLQTNFVLYFNFFSCLNAFLFYCTSCRQMKHHQRKALKRSLLVSSVWSVYVLSQLQLNAISFYQSSLLQEQGAGGLNETQR